MPKNFLFFQKQMVINTENNVNTYIMNKPCMNLTNRTHAHIIVEVNLSANLNSKFYFYFSRKIYKIFIGTHIPEPPKKKRTGLWII